MAAVTLLTSIFNTTAGSKSPTAATPAVGDLPVVITAHTNNTAAVAPTDNNADGLGGSGGYVQINSSALKASSADALQAWVRTNPIGSATSTTWTHNPGTTNGGGLFVFKVTGMSRKGAAAIVQSAIQSNQASSGTPTPVLGAAANTLNALIGAVFNATNPATMTPRTSWTERADVGYNTPTTGAELMSIDSGETASSIAWGGTSASAFASLVLELDTRNTVQVTQSVPDANMTATAAVTDKATVSQSVPDAVTFFSVETYQHTVSPRARHLVYGLNTARALRYFSQGSTGVVSSISVARTELDASLTATAAVVAKVNTTNQLVADATITSQVGVVVKTQVTQSVPDASMSAAVGAVAGLTVAQSVPDAALTATAKAVAGLTIAQSVPDASLTATAGLVAKLTASQSVPDASLTSTVSTQGGLQVHENVPDATLVATAKAITGLSVAQTLPDASLTATAKAVVSLTLSQAVPDATLSATVIHTNSVTPRKRYLVLSNTRRFLEYRSYAANFRTLIVAQSVPDAALVATAKAVAGLAATQTVADVVQTATAASVASITAAQAVPDASLSASVITNLANVHGAYHVYYNTGSASIIAWRGPGYIPPAASITSAQTVPDAALIATAAVTDKASSTQTVADAALVAAAAVIAKAASTQVVPDAALSASAKAVDSLTSTQSVPDAVLAAAVAVIAKAQSTQTVPDATLVALARTNTSASNIIANQTELDAVLFARVIVPNPVHAAQTVPDATLVATINALVRAQVTQVVPDASLVASAKSVDSLTVTQLVDDAALDFRVYTRSSVMTADQHVPDAALVATVVTRQWGLPSVARFSMVPKYRAIFQVPNMIPQVINEQTTSVVSVSLEDKDGNPASPLSIQYQIDCMTTGTNILTGAARATPGPSFTIEVTAQQNAIINPDNPQEYRRLTLIADYANGDQLTAQYDWVVTNLNFIS